MSDREHSIMPFTGFARHIVPLAAAFLGCAVLASTASAGGVREHVYADSFGNLVIYSPAGYKRVVVGKGYLAEELAAYGVHEPEVVYLDEDDKHHHRHYVRDCKRYGVLKHGRSYMYGLPDNAVPVLESDDCY